jgi:alpha-mannosidase
VFDYAHNNSSFQQEFLIEPGAEFIEVTLRGDWREVEKYLKIHFTPQNQGQTTAFADLPYGFTEHLPEGEEYAMQYVAGIRNGKTILTIANDSRYGCLWQDGSLSLSAIRCATWPARISDCGEFEMKYRISAFGATDTWRRRVFALGYHLNLSPCTYAQEYSSHRHLDEGAILAAGLKTAMITCLKPAEDGEGILLRLFNPADSAVEESFSLPAGFSQSIQTNLLEEPLEEMQSQMNSITLEFRPWEIKTLLLKKGT